MERSERFFAWVWRLNGLLLLLLALVGLAGAAVLVANIGIFSTRDRPEQNLTEVAGADLREGDLRLADFYPIEGTPLLYAQLGPPSEYVGSGSSGGPGTANNLLFFDTETRSAHWLLPGNGQVIASYNFLRSPPSTGSRFDEDERKETRPVTIAILLEIRDSPGLKDAPADHPRRLAVATPDGRSVTTIASPIDGMLGYHHARKDSLFVFYVASGSARVLELDPLVRVVRSDALLVTEQGDAKSR